MIQIESSKPHLVGRWLFLLVASAILLAPAIAMQVTSEVNWGPEDFGLMVLMLAIVGVALEASARLSKTAFQRGLTVGVIIFAFLFIWAELAIGIF